MNIFSSSTIIGLSSALLLAGCSTTVVTPEQRELPDTPSQEDAMEHDDTMQSEVFARETVTIDYDRSFIAFQGNSSLVDHEGMFTVYTVDITPDAADPANLENATVEASIDLTSVETDSSGLTGHLQREDFFDVEQYPTATFTSTSIEHTGEHTYVITGDLSLKGVTKTVLVDATITNNYMTAEFAIPRKEFGVGNDSYGDKLLDEQVPVEVHLLFQ